MDGNALFLRKSKHTAAQLRPCSGPGAQAGCGTADTAGEVPGPQWQLSGVTHTVLAASPEASAAEGALGEGQGHRARDRGAAWVSGSVESRDERCAHMTEKVRIK